MQRRVSLGAASVLLVFVACRNDPDLGSFPDGGGGQTGTAGTGFGAGGHGGQSGGVAGAGGGAGAQGGGGAGPQGGGGGAAGVGSTPTTQWAQVTCLVSRTECIGWVEDDSTGLDGVDVNCPTANLVPHGPFEATVCYQTARGGTLAQQQADAQSACDQYCADDGWLGLYPLGGVANKGGAITCSSMAQNDIASEIPGQCSKTTTPSNGATTFALCTLYGRQCNAQETAKDGTQYCTSLPPLVSGQSTSGCFDPTMTTAEFVCQNFFHQFQFPMLPAGAANQSNQFYYWVINQVVLNANVTDCQHEAENIGFAGSGIARGPSVDGDR